MQKKKYLRMIEGIPEGGAAEWSVYMLTCGDGSLYTGIAKNVVLRLATHQAGRGAAYTRTHLPVTLVYEEKALTRSEALIREAAIKRLPRPQKKKLVAGGRQNFDRLNVSHSKGDFHDPSSRQPHPC